MQPMKRVLRLFIYNIIAFLSITYFIPAAQFSNNLEILFISAVIYALLAMFLKPILSIVALPINFLTFGIFSWVVNVILLYLVSRFEPGFKIIAYQFPGFFYQGFVLPRVDFGVFGIGVLVLFLISFVASFFFWLSD